MNIDLIISNFTNPAFLFFILGIVAVRIKSDLEIPENSSKFISLYLLFSIGFKGGQELAQESLSLEVFWSILLAIFLAVSIPIYTFFILKRKFSIQDSGAIAATYGSVSAVTFVTAVSYLENLNLPFSWLYGCYYGLNGIAFNYSWFGAYSILYQTKRNPYQ